MSLLCLNCRGLGTDSTVRELRWLVQRYRPTLLFLSEMKMRDTSVQKFMWTLGYSSSFAVSSVGLSGGLGLFWSSSVSISVKAFNNRCIDVHVTPENGATWRATFVYGEPKRERCANFWDFFILCGPSGRVHGSAVVTSTKCFVMMSTKASVIVQTHKLRISSSVWLILGY